VKKGVGERWRQGERELDAKERGGGRNRWKIKRGKREGEDYGQGRMAYCTLQTIFHLLVYFQKIFSQV
jgi:hypothetical protein